MATKTPSMKDKMVQAMLDLAAEGGWHSVELIDIADKAEVSIENAHEYFDDRADVLAAYGRLVDKQLLSNYDAEEDASCREKLFDLLMERFDVLNDNRAGVIAILDGFKGEPKEAICSFPHLGRSMSRILEAADIETQGIKGAIKVTGLIGIYLYVVRTWRDDDSEDMSKTMTELDKALDKTEAFYNSLPLRS
jgi:AcrR family transcriptional regulator